MDGTEVTVGVLDKVIEQIPKIFDLAGSCFDAVIENPVLLLFFSVSLIGTGLGVFKMMKRTVKG